MDGQHTPPPPPQRTPQPDIRPYTRYGFSPAKKTGVLDEGFGTARNGESEVMRQIKHNDPVVKDMSYMFYII